MLGALTESFEAEPRVLVFLSQKYAVFAVGLSRASQITSSMSCPTMLNEEIEDTPFRNALPYITTKRLPSCPEFPPMTRL